MENPPPQESSGSDASIFLHGDLDVVIIKARSLPNMDMLSERLRRCFTPCRAAIDTAFRSKEPKQQQHHHKIITSDPYVKVCLAGATVACTRVCSNSQDPIWNEHFDIAVAHPVSCIEFHVKDNDIFGAQLIGIVLISAELVRTGERIEGWFDIIGPSGSPPKPGSALNLSMQFKPFDENPLYKRGIAGDPEQKGIPGTYFPLRKGGKVTLYQDAHVREEDNLPTIELENGKVFQHEKCWEDICDAILGAHHLIYIVGWSIYHKVRLVRESKREWRTGENCGNLTLGELLKYKSQEGVRVCLLVWDDKTSHSKFFVTTGGVMQTHDEETRKFFKHSSVMCVLSPRYGSSKLSIVKQSVVGTLFTHHQKCVLVDTQASGNNRKITAFIGGLDLCDGRYDTPEHRLYRNLDTVFRDDYHNPTFPTEGKGPRQPWHDLHCKIEGPAAYDVLKNFEQRWRKATKWWEFGRCFKKERHWHDDALIKLERISWILSPSPTVPDNHPSLWVSNEQDPENWHVQIFRSIDSGSVTGFPKSTTEAEAQNLVCRKNLVIDKSIHMAYVKAIRSAQRFIYIENQYFLGSSYGWPSYKNAGADNLVPMELALKIASKIRAEERFAVYIVIPMWPEGVPTSAAVQEILFWQGQTMQMMYGIVAKELRSMGSNSHPQEYLNFYCLGNREELPKEMKQSTSQLSHNTDVAVSKRIPRFMIYVHAKGMIVDDEYIILGSANINERSLDGSRDTEIAMGSYQPHHSWDEKRRKHPRGQVYGFRTSLWAEHLGKLDDCFKEPYSLECVTAVNDIAKDNWERYVSVEETTLQGHLLKYPIKVEADGKVGSLPGYENFPDVDGKVLGQSSTLPDALTV
ncbi:phospholipase D delta-like isoform X1 [Magnolia sinica]|uniref:phospholipase D delta-like isoform X1 n=1 Tax=Magnolia sinica TaxID=86752 RepID=UPI00265AF1AF|nr:phospholipase D delta-like isoform X1 [Magnolia sinica]